MMYRRRLIIIAVMMAGLFCMSGCKKKAADNESNQDVVVKTAAEYDAEAKEQITEENVDEELDKLEKEVDEDTSAE